MKVQPDIPGRDDPGSGRRLGIDVGTVRIGVASSDKDATLATPVPLSLSAAEIPATWVPCQEEFEAWPPPPQLEPSL